MAAREIVRVLTIKNRTEGAQEAARDLNEVKRAADGVVQASERTERATLSNSRAFDRLQRSVDPAYRSHRQFQSAIQTLSRAVEQNNTSLSEANRLAAMAATRYGIAADEVRDLASAQMMLDRGYIASNRSLSSANDNIRLTSQQMMGLGYQVNDVATMLMMGASPFQIMASQGGHVVQVLQDGPGGVRGSLRALGSQLGSLATRLAPVGIAVAALGSGVAALRSEINETSNANVTFGNVALAVWQMMAQGFTSAFRGPIEAVQGWFATLWENVEAFAVSEFNNIARNMAQLASQIQYYTEAIAIVFGQAFEAAAAAWSGLPAALGDIVYETANRVVQGVEDMVNGAIERINSLISMLPEWAGVDPIGGRVDFGDIGNPFAGSQAAFDERMAGIRSSSRAALAEAGAAHAGRMEGIAAWNPFEDLKAKATANALKDVEEAAKGAGSAIGAAASDNVDPWKGLREVTKETGGAMEKINSWAESFGSTIANTLRQGGDLWDAFKKAGLDALAQIGEALITSGIQSALGGFAGSGGSGFFGTIVNGLGSLLGFDQGGWTGNGSPSQIAGAVHNQEFVVKAGPAARHRPALEAMNSNRPLPGNGGNSFRVEQHFHITGAVSSNDVQRMVRAGAAESVQVVKDNLPGWQNDIQLYGQPA